MAYTIKKGDTLSAIAEREGTTVAALMAVNPSIKDPNKIYAGASLNLPAKRELSQLNQDAANLSNDAFQKKYGYSKNSAFGQANIAKGLSTQQPLLSSSGYAGDFDFTKGAYSSGFSLDSDVSAGSSGSMGGGDRTVYAGSYPSGQDTSAVGPDYLAQAAQNQASLAQQAFAAQQALVPGEQQRILEAQNLIKGQAAGVDPKLASAQGTAQSSLQQALQGLQQGFSSSMQTIAPFAQSGLQSINQILGLSQEQTPTAATFSAKFAGYAPIASAPFADQIKSPQLAQMPSEQESIAQLENNPTYQFQLSQGQKSIEQSAAIRGNLRSGATLKELAQFSQGLASQELGLLRQRQLNEIVQYNQSLLSRYGQDVSQNVASNQAMLGQAGLLAQQQQFNVGQQNQNALSAAQLAAQQQQFNVGQQLAGLQTKLGALQGVSGLGAQAAGQQFGGQQQALLGSLNAQTGLTGSILEQAGQAEQLKTQALTGLIPSLKIGGTF